MLATGSAANIPTPHASAPRKIIKIAITHILKNRHQLGPMLFRLISSAAHPPKFLSKISKLPNVQDTIKYIPGITSNSNPIPTRTWNKTPPIISGKNCGPNPTKKSENSTACTRACFNPIHPIPENDGHITRVPRIWPTTGIASIAIEIITTRKVPPNQSPAAC